MGVSLLMIMRTMASLITIKGIHMRFPQQKYLACSIVVTVLIMTGCSDSSKEVPSAYVSDQPSAQEHSCATNEINETYVYNEIYTAIAFITSQLAQTDFEAKPICEKIS